MKDSHIFALPVEIHIEIGDIFHTILPLLLHTHIAGQNHAYIKIPAVNLLG